MREQKKSRAKKTEVEDTIDTTTFLCIHVKNGKIEQFSIFSLENLNIFLMGKVKESTASNFLLPDTLSIGAGTQKSSMPFKHLEDYNTLEDQIQLIKIMKM